MEGESVRVIDLVGVERLVSGVKWNTTVGQLLNMMYPDTNHKPNATSKDLCLLEVWNGCLNPLPHCKRVSSVLGGWGYLEEERKKVKLMVVSRSKLWSSVVAKQRVKRAKYRCGKVSRNKRSHRISLKNRMGKSKISMVTYIQGILKQLKIRRDAVGDILAPVKPTESPSVDLDSLPEEQRTEAERFLEAIGEEEKEKADLLQRKKEIQERITAQEKELVEAQERVATLETKVLNEQHKLSNLLEGAGPPVMEEITRETTQIRNELKVRAKLNRLQSNKMQEVTSAVLQVEEELKSYQQEIELLRLSTPL